MHSSNGLLESRYRSTKRAASADLIEQVTGRQLSILAQALPRDGSMGRCSGGRQPTHNARYLDECLAAIERGTRRPTRVRRPWRN